MMIVPLLITLLESSIRALHSPSCRCGTFRHNMTGCPNAQTNETQKNCQQDTTWFFCNVNNTNNLANQQVQSNVSMSSVYADKVPQGSKIFYSIYSRGSTTFVIKVKQIMVPWALFVFLVTFLNLWRWKQGAFTSQAHRRIPLTLMTAFFKLWRRDSSVEIIPTPPKLVKNIELLDEDPVPLSGDTR